MKPDKFYLEKAMEEARCASEKDTYPVGAIIVDRDGNIIGRGSNGVYAYGDYTSHAETEAIHDAGSALMFAKNFRKCTLYTTWEPCLMCSGAILLARIARVVWIKDDNDHGALRTLQYLHEQKCSLSRGYDTKLSHLKIEPTNDKMLKKQMDDLMECWSKQKEDVLCQWRQGRKQAQDKLYAVIR
jgi:tRNA(adenine34) deaminase